jgi:micrococcal nuclease
MALRDRVALGAVVLVVVLAGCSLGSIGPADSGNASTPDAMTVKIHAVEDGDTYWFKNESGDSVGIRLLGVDTPEVRGSNYPEEYEGIPDTDAGKEWLYRWGKHSKNVTSERLVGKTVRLEFDSRLPTRDYYGRLVAYVYLNGTLVNRELLEAGHARVYPVDFEKKESFERAEAEARAANRGVWNISNGTVSDG